MRCGEGARAEALEWGRCGRAALKGGAPPTEVGGFRLSATSRWPLHGQTQGVGAATVGGHCIGNRFSSGTEARFRPAVTWELKLPPPEEGLKESREDELQVIGRDGGGKAGRRGRR